MKFVETTAPRFACGPGPTVLQHPLVSGEPTVELLHDRPLWGTAPATATIVSLNVLILALPLLFGGTFPVIHRVFVYILWDTPRLVRDDLYLWRLISARKGASAGQNAGSLKKSTRPTTAKARPRVSPVGTLGGRTPEIVAAGEKISKTHHALDALVRTVLTSRHCNRGSVSSSAQIGHFG